MEEAIDLKETFFDFFSEIEDHRVDRRKLHGVEELLLLTLSDFSFG